MTFNHLVVGSSPTDPIMIDPQDAMERIARLDDEMDIQPKLPIPDQKVFALQMYDRVVIVADLIMEHWLEGNCNPPKELIDQYFETKDEALTALYYDYSDNKNNERFANGTRGMNREFYQKIKKQFKATETPMLFEED